MLYIAPLLGIGNRSTKFGYADDIAILRASATLEENAQRLSVDLERILAWGKEEGITFDPAKAELLHFTRQKLPPTLPEVKAGDMVVKESDDVPYLRWLGIIFDRKLTFKWHARARAENSMKVAKALASLGNTVRGVQPRLLRQVVVACVFPVAYFGAETWWPGRNRPGNSRPVSNRMDTLLETLSRTVLAPNVPDYLHSFGIPPTVTGQAGAPTIFQHMTLPVTKEMVIEEATLKTGMTPISARPLASSTERTATDWVIHFPTGSPSLVSDFKRKVAALQNSTAAHGSLNAIAAGDIIQPESAPEQHDASDAAL